MEAFVAQRNAERSHHVILLCIRPDYSVMSSRQWLHIHGYTSCPSPVVDGSFYRLLTQLQIDRRPDPPSTCVLDPARPVPLPQQQRRFLLEYRLEQG